MSASNVTEKLELIGIKLKNYRSCQKFPEDGECEYLKIGKFTTLIGKNDVGKSNIIHQLFQSPKPRQNSFLVLTQEFKR